MFSGPSLLWTSVAEIRIPHFKQKITMENNQPHENKPSFAKSGSVNWTIIAAVGLVCATILAVLFVTQQKGASADYPNPIKEARKPDVPVFITWRETKLPGQTQVARIWAKPEGQLPLRVMVQVESSVSGNKKVKEVVLERDHIEKPLELGFLEGHTFVPGDIISVGHRDYSPVVSTCKSRK